MPRTPLIVLGVCLCILVIGSQSLPLPSTHDADWPRTTVQRARIIGYGGDADPAAGQPDPPGTSQPVSTSPPDNSLLSAAPSDDPCPPTPGFGSGIRRGPGGRPGQSNTVPRGYPTPTTHTDRRT